MGWGGGGGGGVKDFKKEGPAGSRGECLERKGGGREGWNPFTNYDIYIYMSVCLSVCLSVYSNNVKLCVILCNFLVNE